MVPVIRNYLDQAKTAAENPAVQSTPQMRDSDSGLSQSSGPNSLLNDLDDTF